MLKLAMASLFALCLCNHAISAVKLCISFSLYLHDERRLMLRLRKLLFELLWLSPAEADRIILFSSSIFDPINCGPQVGL